MKRNSLFKCKLLITDKNKIVITNYHQVKEYLGELIIIDEYQIIGRDLQILQMDELSVEILGEIYEIKMEKESN